MQSMLKIINCYCFSKLRDNAMIRHVLLKLRLGKSLTVLNVFITPEKPLNQGIVVFLW